MSEHDGGPAFPEAIAVGPAGDVYPGFSGMTLRDWFAGQALIAISRLWKGNIGDFDNESADRTALAAYRLADAMLAARAAAKGDGR